MGSRDGGIGSESTVFSIGLRTNCSACTGETFQPRVAHLNGECYPAAVCGQNAVEGTPPTATTNRTCRAVAPVACAAHRWMAQGTKQGEVHCSPSMSMCYKPCFEQRLNDMLGLHLPEKTQEIMRQDTCRRVSISNGTCTQLPFVRDFWATVVRRANDEVHNNPTTTFDGLTGGFLELVVAGSDTIVGDRSEGMLFRDPNRIIIECE